MKRRRYRLANIVAIGVALTVMTVGVWWRERFGPNVAASLAGVIGFVSFLLFQALYDAQAEVANTTTNFRIDGVEARHDMEVRSLHHRIDALQARLADFEADRTPPHGIPTIQP